MAQDYAAGALLYKKFTTRDANVPATLSGSPVVKVYKDDSTSTEENTGVTLSVDFDGVTGFNHITIDTSADATFYANGHHYAVVITTGTVGGSSVVGETVWEFDLVAATASAPTAAAVATAVWQDTTSGDFTVSSSIGKSLFTSGAVPGAAGGLFIAGTNAATTITTALTTHFVGTLDTVTTLTNLPTAPTDWLTAAAVKADAVTKIQVGLATPTNITAGTITTTTNLTNLPAIPNNWLTAAGIASGALTSVWDEVNTGATHNLANSTGKQLRSITAGTTDAIYPLSGSVNLTAATSTTATLDVLASNGSQAYQWDVLNILSGTGAGQSRIITSYSTGRVATVSPAFTTTPDITSTFDITPTASVQVVSYIAGQDPATLVWAAVTRTLTTTIPTAAAIATAVWTDTTAGDFTTLTSPGKIIFAQLGGAFTTTSSSVFSTASLANAPTGGTAPTASQVATAVWQDATAGDFTASGSIGKSLFTSGAVPGAAGGLFIAGTNAATTVTTSFTTTFTGNLTGNVGGNVTGTIGGHTAAALAQFFTVDTTKVFADAIGGSVVKEVSTGSGSDPWAVPVPGSYLAGTAGYILGNRLDASISSRSTYSGTDTPGILTLLSRITGLITINEGGVAIDWANVVNPGATVNLANTTFSPAQVVASVSGNVGGNVTGSIGGLTTAALAQFFTVNTAKVYADAVSGSVVHETASNSSGGGSGLTAADVWAYGTRTLTSLGATAPAGWINAASIVDHALDGKGDWSTYAGGDTAGVSTLLGRISGAITINGGGVSVNLAQSLSSARAVDSVADTSLTMNDALHCAISGTAGQAVEDKNALTYVRKTPFTGTVLRTFSIDSAAAPTRRT